MKNILLIFFSLFVASLAYGETVKTPKGAITSGNQQRSTYRLITERNSQALISDSGLEFGKSCAAILGEDRIYDQHKKLSSRFRVEQHYNWACHSDFKTSKQMLDSSTSLGIPVDNLPISLSSVIHASNFEESLNQWCDTAWSSLSDQVTFEEYSRVVDQGMVSAYKTCIDSEKDVALKKFGAFAYIVPEDDYLRSFVVTLEFRPMGFGKLPRITGIEGSNIQCTMNGRVVKAPISITTNSTVLTCTKSSDESRIISFNTDPTGSTLPVKLPGMSEGTIKELDQRTKGLAQAIKFARLNQDTLNNRFTKLRFNKTSCTDIGNCPGCAQPACPPGFADTGITENDTYSGGGAGNGNICRICYTFDK